MRRTKPTKDGTPRDFKGSVFATYSDISTAKRISEIEDMKFKDILLITKMQEQYIIDKKKENLERRAAEKEVKLMKKKEVLEDQVKSMTKSFFVKNSILVVAGFSQETAIDDIKKFFEPYGQAVYVKYETNEKDETQTYVRFSKENEARDAWDKACSSMANKVIYNGNELSGHVLEGEAEQKYWAEFSKSKCLKMDTRQHQRKSRVQPRSKNKAKGIKRTTTGDDENEPKKAKRIVFKDEEDDPVEDTKSEVINGTEPASIDMKEEKVEVKEPASVDMKEEKVEVKEAASVDMKVEKVEVKVEKEQDNLIQTN